MYVYIVNQNGRYSVRTCEDLKQFNDDMVIAGRLGTASLKIYRDVPLERLGVVIIECESFCKGTVPINTIDRKIKEILIESAK